MCSGYDIFMCVFCTALKLKIWYICHKILFSHKNTWNSGIYYNINGSWRYYAKWNKPNKNRTNNVWFHLYELSRVVDTIIYSLYNTWQYLRMWALVLACQILSLLLPFTRCVTMGNLFTSLTPLFPHL